MNHKARPKPPVFTHDAALEAVLVDLADTAYQNQRAARAAEHKRRVEAAAAEVDHTPPPRTFRDGTL